VPSASRRDRAEIAVAVASHERPVRLRWLLEALGDQTLPRERFEVAVAHDSGPETERLLREHPLARAGTLASVRLPAGSAPPGANRNAAWRATSAPLVAFTDDDCRPPADWLERALAAARANPGAIVQGATRPDPEEEDLRRAPHHRTQEISPPTPWAQACNIVYPRALLEDLGGFDPALRAGEDCELAARARAAGARLVGAPEVLTYHAVEAGSLAGSLLAARRWRDLPAVVARHPELRRSFPARFFWTPAHLWFGPALAAAALARRRPAALVLAAPWLVSALPRYGASPRALARTASEAPSRALLCAAECAILAAGSVEHRALLL
jgi:GT2 family glycosyltransferase